MLVFKDCNYRQYCKETCKSMEMSIRLNTEYKSCAMSTSDEQGGISYLETNKGRGEAEAKILNKVVI